MVFHLVSLATPLKRKKACDQVYSKLFQCNDFVRDQSDLSFSVLDTMS